MAKIIWKLQTWEEIKKEIKLNDNAKKFVEKKRKEIKDVFSWKSDKKILIIWPCSADFEESLYKYAEFLSDISKKIEDKIIVVMRFYTWKPRSTVWRKWLQNSFPWEEADIKSWIKRSRKIAINIIEKYSLALADEMLHPQLNEYMDDLYCYQAIWARSSENQYHREVASWLDIAIWIKNTTSWNIQDMVNAIEASSKKSSYVTARDIFETSWNIYSHGILRWWNNWPNYSLDHIKDAYEKMKKWWFENRWILIDTNHANSNKNPLIQIDILKEVLESIKDEKNLSGFVKWFMVESYLYDWRQDYSEGIKKWLSLTDPCIWLENTKKLIDLMYKNV